MLGGGANKSERGGANNSEGVRQPPAFLEDCHWMAAAPVGSLTEMRGETSQDVKKHPFKNLVEEPRWRHE